MKFFGDDPELRKQLFGVITVALAAPGFWEFLKWACASLYTALTGKKKATTQDISDSVQELRAESAGMRSDIAAIKEESRANYEKNLEELAKNNRSKILRFDDELRIGVRHSYEYFEDILRTVKEYEDYCQSHPNFQNRQAQSAINHIQAAYDKAHQDNSFI